MAGGVGRGYAAGYLRQLPAPLAAINLQHRLLSHRAEQVKTYEADNGRTELRAVTGPDYGRIYDHELVEAVQRIADNGTGDTRWKVPGVAVLPASRMIGRMTIDLPSYNIRSSLRDDLTRMGLSAGDAVMVHAAMSKVGPMLNGPDALSTALLDVIGPEGTMLVYTSWDSVHDDLLDDDGRVLSQWRDHVPGFDPQASRAVRMNGIIAEFVRTMPGARRSGNPGASVAAIGKRADWITAGHLQDYGYGEPPRTSEGGRTSGQN